MEEEETALVAGAPKRQATLDLSAVAEDRGDIRMSTNGENLRNQLGLVATISPSMETCEEDNELQKAVKQRFRDSKLYGTSWGNTLRSTGN